MLIEVTAPATAGHAGSVSIGVGLGLGDGDGEGDADGEGDGDGDGEVVGEGDGDGEDEGEAVGDGVAEGGGAGESSPPPHAESNSEAVEKTTADKPLETLTTAYLLILKFRNRERLRVSSYKTMTRPYVESILIAPYGAITQMQ